MPFPGEYIEFNLAEYMVLLDKPVGLTLAPEPHTGRVRAAGGAAAVAAAAAAAGRRP
jgi:hypothetical protein